jgi:hypothetical protein
MVLAGPGCHSPTCVVLGADAQRKASRGWWSLSWRCTTLTTCAWRTCTNSVIDTQQPAVVLSKHACQLQAPLSVVLISAGSWLTSGFCGSIL